jgi:peptide/nickel transport system substrate-binding protein
VRGGCARIAIEADPGALIPYATASASSTDVQGFLFHQLVELRADLSTFAPCLAAAWRWEDDHRNLVVQLRSGLLWSDGVPLDAEDVRFSFEVARDPRVGWGGAAWKSRIQSCEVVDRTTVRFRFDEAYPDQLMDANAGFIIPRHILESVPRAQWSVIARDPKHSYPRAVVGSGPFQLAAWEPGQRVVLERNQHYFEADRPRLDRVEFTVLSAPADRVRALSDGKIDFLSQVPEQEAVRLRDAYDAGTSDVRVVSLRGRQYDFICYDPQHLALGNREVRRALTQAVDRAAIIRSFCSGFAEPFESPIVPILWAYDETCPITPYDPSAARHELDQSGWRLGTDGVRERSGVRLEFELMTNVESARRAGTARLLQDYWNVIGARVHLRLSERSDVLERLDNRRFEAALSGWRARLKPDLEPMWGCSSVGSKTNRVDYCNPDVDRLNAAALRTPDLDEARRLFAAAQRLIANDYPYTWLYYLHDVVGVRERLQDATIDARGVFLNPEEWWIAPSPTS